ncbi:unnamed protein product (mitochondrion) [Plasmodiophora brassicae]|uniref:Uncharacterized protein n=1 Tax=Plasmodiophora brassicae TaxID=37360 RepID=A0A3P3YK77_PLABS|nr:unnamed protein product [Plasmodiophora brassicae]
MGCGQSSAATVSPDDGRKGAEVAFQELSPATGADQHADELAPTGQVATPEARPRSTVTPIENAAAAETCKPTDPEPPAQNAFVDPEDSADLPAIDLQAGLAQVGGDRAFLMVLIDDLLSERRHRVEAMQVCITRNDLKHWAVVADALNSSAMAIGLASLARTARVMQRYAVAFEAGSTTDPVETKGRSLCSRLEAEYDLVNKALAKLSSPPQ